MKPNLEQAVSALKSGQRTRARQLLVEIVKDQPKNAQAWYVLSFVVDNQNQQIYCLQRVLKFAPEHQAARTKLEKLISQSSSQYNSTEYHSPKDTQVEQTDTSPVVENDKNFNVSTRPSLSSIFQQWFRVLSYREQKVIEYLYLDVNEFSTSAVGRIIGEDLQKVLEIKRKASGKLCQPDAFAIAEPLFDWYRLRTKGNSESSAASNIVDLFSRDWEIGNISPIGVSRLLTDIEDERKGVSPIKERNSRPVAANPPKNREIAMSNRLSQTTGETQIFDSEQNLDPIAERNHLQKILHSNPTPLAELGLSARVHNALFRSGIKTIGQLAALPETQLWQTKSIGEAAVKEIQRCLQEYEAKPSASEILAEVEGENTEEIGFENTSAGLSRKEKIQSPLERSGGRHFADEVIVKAEGETETIDGTAQIDPPPRLGTEPISVLGLSTRSYNVLMRNDIQTLWNLVSLSEEDLLGLRNAGIKTVNEILAKLADYLVDNKIESDEYQRPSNVQADRPTENETIEDSQIETDSNSSRYWLLSFLEAESFSSKPLDRISIKRLALSKPMQDRLLQKGVRTISDILTHKEEIHPDSEIGRSLRDYLEWLVEQDESVWLDEARGKGLEPLSKLRLAKTTCEILIVEWLDLLSDEREKWILMWRYGINSTPLTLQDIGGKLDRSKERVRQIEKGGLRRLRNNYEKQGQQVLKPLTDYLKLVFEEHDGLINESEIEAAFSNDGLATVGNVDLIGSLALLCEIDDRFQYHKKHRWFALGGFSVATITKVQNKISKVLKEKLTPIYREELFSKLRDGDLWRGDQERVDDKFLFACLRTHPNVEVLESGAYAHANASRKRLGAIVRALREIGEPAHYSVITEKTNAFLKPDEQFTERAIHAKLGQHPDIFVWIRLRGTYGLKEWGLEQGLSYVDAIEQIFLEEGRPLTFEQVLERMPTHREHFDEGSVVITLGTHEKFKGFPNNTYGLSSWKNNMPRMDFEDMFGEQLAQRQTELDRHNSQPEIDTQSEIDKIRRIGLDFFAP